MIVLTRETAGVLLAASEAMYRAIGAMPSAAPRSWELAFAIEDLERALREDDRAEDVVS